MDETQAYDIVIYSGGDERIEEILAKVENSFGIRIKSNVVQKVTLATRGFIEAARYPVATLMFQFLGSILLMAESLVKKTPGIMIDTHGQSFGYFLCKLSGIPVIAYVHYPVISTDMIQRVRDMRPSYNNSSLIASTTSVSYAKLAYYHFLLFWYSTSGWFCDLALCNSSWTLGHISSIWRCKQSVVFPPCDVKNFLSIPMSSVKEPRIISIGQFRPEKDHELQIFALSKIVKDMKLKDVKLTLVGSCRDEEDRERVRKLKELAKELGLVDNVEFHNNVNFKELLRLASISMVGLHTMWNEHFGICVVELMASGLVTVAHNSAGPKMDIIDDKVNGLLASNVDEYANCISDAILRFDEMYELRVRAREKVMKFSQELFEVQFRNNIRSLL